MEQIGNMELGPRTEHGRGFALHGIEPDNFLAFLAVLGVLRAIEIERPDWRPRVSWSGPPWLARLWVETSDDEKAIAAVASAGCARAAARFDVDGRANVKFTRAEYRAYAERVRTDPVGAALAAALVAELPERRDGSLRPSPLVMMFGQGHQNFLDRLVAVPRGDLPNRFKKKKSPPDMADPAKIAEALFQPWRRADDADAFRWDPEEDQRYALRYDDPSAAGAAPTVHGANRLAALGFLSYACAPRAEHQQVRGVLRTGGEVFFVWPLWERPLCRTGIEALLAHPSVLHGDLESVRSLGVLEILRAQRISNGKFMNVTRASPHRAAESGRRDPRARPSRAAIATRS